MRRRGRFLAGALLAGALLMAGYGLMRDPLRPQTVDRQQRCPVCGMHPALFPNWMAQIVMRDGGMVAFDSPGEMLRYLHDLPRYGKGRTLADIGRIYVSDHAGGGWVPAEEAFFVAGSRVLGPMREVDYPAFSQAAAADAFARREGGEVRRYLQIAQVAPRPHPTHRH